MLQIMANNSTFLEGEKNLNPPSLRLHYNNNTSFLEGEKNLNSPSLYLHYIGRVVFHFLEAQEVSPVFSAFLQRVYLKYSTECD